MNLNHNTSFTVYPDMCNYMTKNEKPMVHGGYMLMMMDRVAAECCRRLLYDAKDQSVLPPESIPAVLFGSKMLIKANSALTVNVNDVTFYVGATLGDIIFLEAQVIELGIKRIVIQVNGEREDHNGKREKICDGKFTFCAMYNAMNSTPHGLKLEK